MASKFSSFNSNDFLISDICAKILLCIAYNVKYTVIPVHHTTWYYMYSVYVDPCTPILQYYLYMLTPVLQFYSTTCTCGPLYTCSTVLPVHVDPSAADNGVGKSILLSPTQHPGTRTNYTGAYRNINYKEGGG